MGMLFENMQKMDIQEERSKTAEQRMRAEKAEQKLEDCIRLFVESCQEFGISKASIKDKLAAKFDLDKDSAAQAIASYFKET